MFTVKHYASNGTHRVFSCDHYVVTPPHAQAQSEEAPLVHVALFDPNPHTDDPHPSKMCISVFESEVAYIENAEGHTVDVVRLAKVHESLP